MKIRDWAVLIVTGFASVPEETEPALPAPLPEIQGLADAADLDPAHDVSR